jgi:hypothetical protein
VDGIKHIAARLSAELKHRLPHQRKTQRGKLALRVATMLDVRSANLMDLAAGRFCQISGQLAESAIGG